jgi:hypothetical protein
MRVGNRQDVLCISVSKCFAKISFLTDARPKVGAQSLLHVFLALCVLPQVRKLKYHQLQEYLNAAPALHVQ